MNINLPDNIAATLAALFSIENVVTHLSYPIMNDRIAFPKKAGQNFFYLNFFSSNSCNFITGWDKIFSTEN